MSNKKQYTVFYKLKKMKPTSKGLSTRDEVLEFIDKVGATALRNIESDQNNLTAEETLRLLRDARVFSN